MGRSVNAEVDLEAGQYCVIIKVAATRNKTGSTPEEIIRKTCQTRRDKLMAVGLSYDLAHAKGNFKESELERTMRLQNERRAKRKENAQKSFEAERQSEKKEKLRRKRLEAKEQAKKGQVPDSNQNPDDNVEITIRIGENVMNLTKPHGKNEIVDGKSVVEHEGTNKKLKLTLEASDKAEGAKDDEETPAEEPKQIEEASDNKQATATESQLKEAKDESQIAQGGGEITDGRDTSASAGGQENGLESSTSASGVTPSTSAESTAEPEDGNMVEVQPGDKHDSTATEAEKTAVTEGAAGGEAAAETGADADEPDANKLNIPSLTLDDISDDGLSWASDIDAPSDSSSESDSDEASPPPTDPPGPGGQQEDEFASDPWNAICVVGLRVYSKGSPAEIEIVRKRDGGDSVESKKLDVDDQAADATKKLQKRNTTEERQLENVGSAPEGEEVSKQG